jgi:glycosyltransferase involved in cell wall biosynthesis
MNLKRLVYIVSEIDKSLHFEWISPLLQRNFELSFILICRPGSEIEKFLTARGIGVTVLSYGGKRDLVRVWFQVFLAIIRIRPQIVHTHLWIANLTGLTAAWLAGVEKRIYTRHHATIHHNKYPSGLKWDRLNNRIATHIIAISENVRRILLEMDKADAKKVRLIRHGFNFSYFQNVDDERISRLRKKYGISSKHHPVVGVISRFIEWKGIQYAVAAFRQLRISFPEAHLILANAHGDFEPTVDQLLSELSPTSFTKIRFEQDLAALYRLFDVFVHVPVDPESEAFGQTYVEPLIIGIPSIFTKSGIAREFVIHKKNALVVEFRSADQIYEALSHLLEDQDCQRTLIVEGKKSVEAFTMERYFATLKDVYLE